MRVLRNGRLIRDSVNSMKQAAEKAARHNDSSLLLKLPVEMLQRITSLLDPEEVLPSLRLTCKTLEVAAYERFVSVFVQERRHCIFYKESWARLQKLLDCDSPFTARLQSIVLTTNCLGQADSQDIQLAPTLNEGSIEEAQLQACTTHASSESKALKDRATLPNERYMKRILLVLRDRYPRVLIKYDLFRNQSKEFGDLAIQRAFFLAVSSADSHIHHLTMSQPCIKDMEDLPADSEPRLLSCLSSLRVFRIRNSTKGDIKPKSVPTQSSGFVETILMCATQLQSLELRFSGCLSSPRTVGGISTRLLRACQGSALVKLKLRHLNIPENVLLESLICWKSMLAVMDFCKVRLTDARGGWQAVFQSMSASPRLKVLSLWKLSAGSLHQATDNSYLSLESLIHGDKTINGGTATIHYHGREEVNRGLQEVLAKPLTYRTYAGG